MAMLPQVYASEDDLARTDAVRQTRREEADTFARTQIQQQQQQQQQQPPRPLSQSVRLPSPMYRPSSTVSRTYGGGHSYTPMVNPYSHVQRPQTGIAPIPKEFQPRWQDLLAAGPHRYMGDTFTAALKSHSLSSEPEPGHAFGPQTLAKEIANGDALPDADHRQAWANQPTFRWFKRSDYSGVKDRWAAHEGMLGRGDNHYRPPSVAEQQRVNENVDRRLRTKGLPRTGQW